MLRSLSVLFLLVLAVSDASEQHLRNTAEWDTHQEKDHSRMLGKKGTHCREVLPLGPDEFDLDLYIEKSWYIQRQQINPYQGINDLYCTTATYNERSQDDLIQILNIDNTDSVNGPQTELNPDCLFNFGTLCARNINGGGQFTVSPCLFQLTLPFTAGPYWLVALGEAYDGSPGYSWAIVIAGQPMEEIEEVNGQTFCITPNDKGTVFLGINLGPALEGNGQGLWLLSRNNVYNATEIAVQEAKLTELGIYTGYLKDVVHSGCSYPDFVKT